MFRKNTKKRAKSDLQTINFIHNYLKNTYSYPKNVYTYPENGYTYL